MKVKAIDNAGNKSDELPLDVTVDGELRINIETPNNRDLGKKEHPLIGKNERIKLGSVEGEITDTRLEPGWNLSVELKNEDQLPGILLICDDARVERDCKCSLKYDNKNSSYKTFEHSFKVNIPKVAERGIYNYSILYTLSEGP